MTETGLAVDAGRAFARPRPGRAYRQATAALLWLFILGNGAGSVALWFAQKGEQDFGNWAVGLTSVGRVTGMLGAYLALVQVILLARIPWIERLTGFDRLTVLHRWNGKASLYLVVAHVVFITVGYMKGDRTDLWGEIRSLLTTSYPGMVTATIGTVLFVVVALSSYTIARKRMRFELWYLVHFTAYASIALAWFHQIPTGTELNSLDVPIWYWRSLYLATLALLLVFRVAVPAWQAWRHALRVQAVEHEGPGVVTLTIGGRGLERLHAHGGQFFLWRFLTRRSWLEAHPFSLSAAPDGRALRITVKGLGDFTRRLADEVRPGTRVLAEGPFGVFTTAVRRRDKVALVAGGIGITPVRALLEEMGGDIVVLYRVVRDEDVVFRDELDELAAARGAAVHYVVGDHAAPQGAKLLSAAHLHELVPDIAEREVWLCGPPAMADAAERSLREAGVERRALHVERFAL